MRRVPTAVLTGVCVAVCAAPAGGGGDKAGAEAGVVEAGSGGGPASPAYRYIEAGAGGYRYAVVDAPRLTGLVGGAGLAALGAARGQATVSAEPGVKELAPAEGAAPFGGPDAEFVSESAKGKKSKQGPATVLDRGDRRVAVLRVSRTFTVGPEAARVRVLELRARYRDGLVARLNGVEVARRNIEPDVSPAGFARRVRGPEPEVFYVAAQAGLLRQGENVLEVEVRPHAVRAAPSLDLELVGLEQIGIVRGPIVQQVSGDSALVVFETGVAVAGEVRWGGAASAYQRKLVTPAATRHEARLTGLTPGQAVHYQVRIPDEATGDLVFHAAPSADEPLRFVVYGDVRSGHDTHARVIDAVMGEAPDLVLTTGDMVLRGSDEAEWQLYFELCAELMAAVPVYPAVGNHDLGEAGDAKRRVDGIFALPTAPAGRPDAAAWYGFDVAGVHFVMLDSNRYEEEAQLAWLGQDLAAARKRGVRAIFAVAHHGPYSRGLHGGSTLAATRYAPLLVQHGVDLFFSGHDHLYQRGEKNGLRYVVSGGGGAGLYKPRCGVPGKKKCKVDDGAVTVTAEHHYLLVEVLGDQIRLCPRRPDGTALEKCVIY